MIHIVKPGQSLWSIAIAYGTHINELQRLNGFANDLTTVYTGQKLLVPTNADSPPPALSATPEPEQSKTGITEAARSERPVSLTPTLLDISTEASSATQVPQTDKGSTQTVAIIIIVVFLFGTSLVATGSLWRNKTV